MEQGNARDTAMPPTARRRNLSSARRRGNNFYAVSRASASTCVRRFGAGAAPLFFQLTAPPRTTIFAQSSRRGPAAHGRHRPWLVEPIALARAAESFRRPVFLHLITPRDVKSAGGRTQPPFIPAHWHASSRLRRGYVTLHREIDAGSAWECLWRRPRLLGFRPHISDPPSTRRLTPNRSGRKYSNTSRGCIRRGSGSGSASSSPSSLATGVLTVRASTMIQQQYLSGKCREIFNEAAQAVTGKLVTVDFVTGSNAGGGLARFGDSYDDVILSPDYVFENFVTGPCNRLAYAACTAVAEKAGRAYNPLFIHGGCGLGKTHLLQATCQDILRHSPESRILYLSCDTFINHFIECVRQGRHGGVPLPLPACGCAGD